MKDDKVYKIYNQGKRRFYLNTILGNLSFSIANVGTLSILFYLDNSFEKHMINLLIYSFLIQFTVISIISIVVKSEQWKDIIKIYNNLQEQKDSNNKIK